MWCVRYGCGVCGTNVIFVCDCVVFECLVCVCDESVYGVCVGFCVCVLCGMFE